MRRQFDLLVGLVAHQNNRVIAAHQRQFGYVGFMRVRLLDINDLVHVVADEESGDGLADGDKLGLNLAAVHVVEPETFTFQRHHATSEEHAEAYAGDLLDTQLLDHRGAARGIGGVGVGPELGEVGVAVAVGVPGRVVGEVRVEPVLSLPVVKHAVVVAVLGILGNLGIFALRAQTQRADRGVKRHRALTLRIRAGDPALRNREADVRP